MSDLISRKVKGLFIPDITAEMFRNGCLESIEALMAEGEIYDIDYEPEQRWIPCSERLPDIGKHHTSEPCIVYCENGSYGFAELEENIFGQTGWNCERDADFIAFAHEVIAWMPLPEPYKADMRGERNEDISEGTMEEFMFGQDMGNPEDGSL